VVGRDDREVGAYLITRRMLAEFDRYDNGDLPNLPDQLIERSKYAQARNDLEKENPQFVKAADQLYEFPAQCPEMAARGRLHHEEGV
jgi:hypothetical protein